MAGVPTAALQRQEREANDLRARGIDPTSGAPVAVQVEQPASAPTPSPTPAALSPTVQPAPAEPAPDVSARIRQLEEALSTANGRASAASAKAEAAERKLDAVDNNRTFLESKLTEQQSQLESQKAQLDALTDKQASEGVSKVLDTLKDAELTPAMKEKFDAETTDYVQRVVKPLISQVLSPVVERLAVLEKALGRVKAVEDALPPLRAAAEVTTQHTAQAREMDFLRLEILPHFSDFDTVKKTPEWQEYLQSKTARGYLIGDMLNHYRRTSDASAIRTLIGAFYDKRTAAPTLDSLAVPGKTGADAPLDKPAAPKMKASEYLANLRRMTSKKMPQDEWKAFRARWDEQYAAGNVEMDAEIR